MSEITDYSRGEPEPVPNNNASVHTLVTYDVIDFERHPETVRNHLIQLLIERREFGFSKYKTLLQANNGRDPLNDLLEEMGDAIVYARQFIEEKRPGVARMEHVYKILINVGLNLVALREDIDAHYPNPAGLPAGSKANNPTAQNKA
jgi:hypothetical protein